MRRQRPRHEHARDLLAVGVREVGVVERLGRARRRVGRALDQLGGEPLADAAPRPLGASRGSEATAPSTMRASRTTSPSSRSAAATPRIGKSNEPRRRSLR